MFGVNTARGGAAPRPHRPFLPQFCAEPGRGGAVNTPWAEISSNSNTSSKRILYFPEDNLHVPAPGFAPFAAPGAGGAAGLRPWPVREQGTPAQRAGLAPLPAGRPGEPGEELGAAGARRCSSTTPGKLGARRPRGPRLPAELRLRLLRARPRGSGVPSLPPGNGWYRLILASKRAAELQTQRCIHGQKSRAGGKAASSSWERLAGQRPGPTSLPQSSQLRLRSAGVFYRHRKM